MKLKLMLLCRNIRFMYIKKDMEQKLSVKLCNEIGTTYVSESILIRINSLFLMNEHLFIKLRLQTINRKL